MKPQSSHVHFELRLLVSEFPVNGALDLPGLLQEL